MAQSACFVAELDYTIPKAIVDKAHQVLSRKQQENRSRSVAPLRPSAQPATPYNTKKEKCSPTREGARPATPLFRSPTPPASTDRLRCLTPALRVRGLLRPDHCEKQEMTAAARTASPISIVHTDACDHEFEVQGTKLLDEPVRGLLATDINLKGLACNHAHDYLVPRSVEPTLQPAVMPAPRKERVVQAALLGAPGSPRTLSGTADHPVAPTPCHTSNRRKPVQILGWDDTERGYNGALPAFFEGGVNSTETVVTPACFEAPPEIWDYVGQV